MCMNVIISLYVSLFSVPTKQAAMFVHSENGFVLKREKSFKSQHAKLQSEPLFFRL